MAVMTARGLKPNIATYNSLFHGVYHSGLWREVNKLLDKMQVEAIPLDV